MTEHAPYWKHTIASLAHMRQTGCVGTFDAAAL